MPPDTDALDAPPGLALRVLQASEVEQRSDELLALLSEALAASPIASTREWQLEPAGVDLRRCVEYPQSFSVITAEAPPGETAGFALVRAGTEKESLPRELEAQWPGWAANAVVLIWLAVLPRWRRQGIGAALHDAALRRYDRTRAYLYVEPENQPALAMYARRGWFELGRQRQSLMLGWQQESPPEPPAA